MRIEILTVGVNKIAYLTEGEKDYLNRLKHYCNISMKSVKEEKVTKKQSVDKIIRIEEERLISQISAQSWIVALDRRGEMLSSEDLAQKMIQWQNRSVKEIIFIIGGVLGLSDKILRKVNLVISLSRMTFTHEMIRLILLEQLYRGFTILRGEKYHK
jgi:23S rRNA (pseudouridine1915-N3)-methyltransferase